MIEKIVKKAKKGCSESFNYLVLHFKNDLYKIAKVKLDNEEDVCDVVQETFIAAYKNINKLRNPKNFKTWLITILINKCNDFYRTSRNNIRFIDDNNLENCVSRETDIHSNLDFFDLISELNSDEKTILILYYSEEYKIKEISKILNMNFDTTKSKLKRARKKIEEKLNKENILWKN